VTITLTHHRHQHTTTISGPDRPDRTFEEPDGLAGVAASVSLHEAAGYTVTVVVR
jgi:hypothetical protein